jgi:hypothetical protein
VRTTSIEFDETPFSNDISLIHFKLFLTLFPIGRVATLHAGFNPIFVRAKGDESLEKEFAGSERKKNKSKV